MAEQVLHHMFRRWAERTPGAEALAVVGSDGDRVSLTYAELERSAGRFADALADVDLPAHQPVLIVADRGTELITAMLGTLIAGGAFVVANPAHPVDRLRNMIAAARPAVVVAGDGVSAPIRGLLEDEFPSIPVVSTTVAESIARTPRHPTITREDPAYVAFTSGSTGTPKGIPHRHATLQQFVDWQGAALGVTTKSRMAALAPPGFDVSFCETFGALSQGASLHLVTEGVRNDPVALAQWLRDERISVLQIVPAHWSAVLEQLREHDLDLPDLATVVFVGEALTPDVVDDTRRALGAPVRLVNIYGPTEVVAATFHEIGDLDPALRTVPIGAQIPGRQVTLRDDRGQPVDEGEVWIASPFLTPGYLNDDGATSAAFVSLPESNEIAYRSGDVARRLTSGDLLFVGRTDNQVKIRGQRVELEDVEAAVAATGLAGAAVVAVKQSTAGAPTLVVFVEPRDPVTFAADDLLEQLALTLPRYMVPAAVAPVDRLPRNANGKIDRRAVAELPLPDSDATPDPDSAPRGEIELAIARIWSDVVGRDDIARDAGFFRIGGDSLMATRILSRVRTRMGVRVSLGTFFDKPTIADLAAAVAVAPASPRIDYSPRSEQPQATR